MYQIDVLSGPKGQVAQYQTKPVMEQHRGWVFGEFVKTPDGEPISTAFEIKMQTIVAGASREEWSRDPAGECVVIVISGKFRYWFVVDEDEIMIEVGPAEAVAWHNTVPHKWLALETTEYFCVRKLS